jgi:hypothetical protein
MEYKSKSVDLSKFLESDTTPDNTFDIVKPLTAKGIQSKNFSDIVESAHQSATVNALSSLNKGKGKTFGADMDHLQFERYYNHPKFAQLGFKPFVDNESRYNAVSSFSDDFRRSWGQWKTMVGNAFVDAAGFGPASDREAAKAMEKSMAIGTSTRGGIGGFTNNLFLNSGYTFGIMGEILAEEVALWGATALTGGAAGEMAIARTSVNAGRAAKALFSAAEWSNKANKIINALDNIKDIGVARSLYNSLVTGGTAAGKFIAKNAAGETYDFLSNFNKLENLSGKAKTAVGFGSFYRDIRNVRLAFGESALEGGMVENEMLRSEYDKFLQKTGREPNDQEAAEIRATAKSAALSTTWTNLPIIYFSNQIVLGNMMKSFSPLRKILPIDENKFFKTILTKDGFKAIEKNAVNAAKSLIKPRTYGAFALNYLSANLAEGLQESAQEVISGTNKQYYSSLYSNKTRGGYYDAIADNIAKQFSPEGLEIFASGFFMGGIVSAASGVGVGVKEQVQKFTDKGYVAKKDAARQSVERKATILNEIYKDPLKYTNLNLDNAVEQQNIENVMVDAEKQGDAKTFQDAKWRSMANHFWTVFETGMDDTFLERFEDLQQLNDEELLGTVSGTDAAKIRQDLADVSSKMKEFREGYDYVTKSLANPFDPSNFKPGTPEYNDEVYAFRAFQAAQKDLIFMREGLKNTTKRMNSIVSEAIKDVGIARASATDVTNLYDFGSLNKEINQLKKEIQSFPEEDLYTQEAKNLKKEKERKLANLEAFDKAMFNLATEVIENDKAAPVNEEEQFKYTKEHKVKAATYNEAFDAYKTYMKGLSKKPVMESNLQTAFDKLVDYYKLDTESANLINSVNTLVNPNSFYEHARRKKQVIRVEHENRKQRIDDALKGYEEIVDQNTLLKELYNRNIFFDPKDWQMLKDEGKMPKRFYFKNVSGNDQILTTSSEYNEAVHLVQEYFQKKGMEVSEIQLQYDNRLDQYDTEIRDKLPGDNRSYEDIAEQYGFDPTARKTTLPLREVLQAIVDSDYATEQEQALARRMLTMAKSHETVTFSKELAGPGIYTEAEQTVIDARYSSEEYAKNVQSYPIETSILREEVNRRIHGLLESDSQFASSIEELYRLSLAYYAEMSQLGAIEKMPLGLRAMDDFLKETLTNESFRDFLHEIPYDNEGKTAWSEFVDKVVYTLSNTVGEFSNTALNAVINVVTTKIDSVYAEAQAQASGRPSPMRESRVENPQELSLEQIELSHPALVNELIKLYQDYNAVFADIGDTSKMLDPDYASKTPEEIKASPQFREFVKMQNPKIIVAFDKYYKSEPEVRIIERRPGIKQTITETEQTFLLTGQINKLRELGYSDDEIADMTPLEGLNIIYQGETKEETAARLQRERDELSEDRDAARKEIYDLIKGIDDINEWIAVEAEIIARSSPFFWSRTGFKAEELTELLNNKRQELAFKTEFDDIKEGDYIMINNLETNTRGVWEVVNKTKNKVSLTNEKGSTYTLTRKKFKEDNDKRYIFKYRKEMNMEDLVNTPISNEEQSVSNDDVRSIESISDEDVVNAINKGKKRDADEAYDDFLDSLDDIC